MYWPNGTAERTCPSVSHLGANPAVEAGCRASLNALAASSPPTEALTPAAGEVSPVKIRVASGPDFGKELVLERASYRVGKAPDCDLVLTDRAVSNSHLVIEPLKSGVRFTDNGSTNGTFYRGARISSVVLSPPAVLTLGRSELQLVLRDSSSSKLPPSEAEAFGGLIGKSLPMRQLFAQLERLTKSDADVLIQAETGSGKEVCARALHQQSARSQRPFEVCDIAGLTATLCESELFGHVKGAFTGASDSRMGVFERAKGGTVFLDEVAEMPLELQPRLLRVLERREVKPVGGNAFVPVDVRVISATHRRLEEEVKAGRVREDLYFRLSSITVEIPPLRDRLEDIPMLVDQFLAALSQAPRPLQPLTQSLLWDYAWPGNVRELKNVVLRAVSLGGALQLPGGPTEELDEEGSERAPSGPPGFKAAKEELVDAFERDYLERLLKQFKNNVTQAAAAAGITRVYLQKLMKKHELR
jgi:two-component system nitrogen regulation response regulator GlnG